MAEVDFSPEQCTAFPIPERTTLQLYYTYFLNKHSAQWCIPEDIVKLVVSYSNNAFCIGDEVLAESGGGVYEAKVVAIEDNRVQVTFNLWGPEADVWLSTDADDSKQPLVENFRWHDPIRKEWKYKPRYAVGQVIRVLWLQTSYLARVVDVVANRVKINYDAFGPEWDEWLTDYNPRIVADP
jgi:hypothetical protein